MGPILGFSVHSIIFRTEWKRPKAAIKVHGRESGYRRERGVYLHLEQLGAVEVHRFTVPRFLRHDDALRVIAMSIVPPPYLLDFGS